jgi:hypothetical protein
LNGWWFAAGCVGLFLIYSLIVSRRDKRQVAALAVRRENVGREQFITMLANDCEPDVAEFLWDELVPEWAYWHAGLTPHPDDDFLKDLSIDDEEPQDWLEHYCESRGLDWHHWTNWDRSQPTTVRNFARWLSNGPASPVVDAAA